jgi:hypothetical protein
MRDAIAALETALGSLEEARSELPPDLRGELGDIIEQARAVLESIRAKAPAELDAGAKD